MFSWLKKGKESFDSWLYGSIVNNPVDPRWAFMILKVGLIDQFANIGSLLKIEPVDVA